MAYTKYSLTPADNNAAPPNGAPEGMLPSAVNDTMRDMMSQIRDVGDGIRGGTYTMTAPVITGGSITGSTINNSAIGGTTAAAGKFTTLEATGVTTLQAGTVSAPAITTTGDTNTGIFFPAADTIAFTEGGVESGRFTSTGALQLNANLTFSGTGNRILGDFSNATAVNRVSFQSSTTNGNTLVQAIPNGTATNSQYRMYNNSDVTNASVGIMAMIATELQFTSTLTGTGSFLPITMYTGGSERLRIDTSGNCGIGTTNPTTKLFIDTTTSATAITCAAISSTASQLRLGIAAFTAGLPSINGTGNGLDIGSTDSSPVKFFTANTERMRIDSSGQVGIGVTSPNQRLEVGGTIRASRVGTPTTFMEIFGGDGSIDPRINVPSGFGIPFNVGGSEKARIDSSGTLLVGTTNTDPTFNRVNGTNILAQGRFYVRANGSWDLGRDVSSGAHITFYTDNGSARVTAGNITSNGSTTTYATSSDYRMKTDVQPMADALNRVMQLKPVTYKWVNGLGGTKETGDGFIAHELQAVVPDCVTGEKDAVDKDGKPVYQGIDTSFLVATLTAAIKEQQAMIETLTTRLNALEGK
jgi:hypothetical protein